MVSPNDLVVGGWDISKANLAEAMERALVLDWELQKQLVPHMRDMVPLPAIFDQNFVAANQGPRADNVLRGTKVEQVAQVQEHIRAFKEANALDKVIVLWTANTERYADVLDGLNDTADNLLAAIERGESEVAPSTLYAVAAINEGCPFINGAPQNTFVPGLIELAERKNVLIGGDDFKSGQTKASRRAPGACHHTVGPAHPVPHPTALARLCATTTRGSPGPSRSSSRCSWTSWSAPASSPCRSSRTTTSATTTASTSRPPRPSARRRSPSRTSSTTWCRATR